jgi:VIT1/CCC1 family predicted Fe2+/Mn2+ transporter
MKSLTLTHITVCPFPLYTAITMTKKVTNATYLRTFVFGVEDSLVSTVGLVSGVAIAGLSKEAIIATGLILVFVEAVSMSAGSFLSESSAEEYQTHKRSESLTSIRAALIMFVSYALAGFIPLLPYAFLPSETAFSTSIIVSLLALGVLGAISASFAKIGYARSAVRMVLIGGAAIAVGVGIGHYLGV